MRRSAGQFSAIAAEKAADQSDLLQRSAGSVPRNPETVRVPQRRGAVMILQCVGWKYILAIWSTFHGTFAVIPGINDE